MKEGLFLEQEGAREIRLQRPNVQMTLDVSNVEDALAEAAKQWHLPVEDLNAEVLGTGARAGFLGLFGKKLRVEVRPKSPLLLLQGQHFVETILKLMDFNATVSLRTEVATGFDTPDELGEPNLDKADLNKPDDAIEDIKIDIIEIEGPDADEFIVGRYGDALKSLEYLLNLSLRDPAVEPRVRVDSCGYRARRTKSLKRLAEATARQAVEYGRPIRLEPMLSWERWVIHMTLKNRKDVKTESIGETPTRKVVVMPTFESESGIDGRYPSQSRGRSRIRNFSRYSNSNYNGYNTRDTGETSYGNNSEYSDYDYNGDYRRPRSRSRSHSRPRSDAGFSSNASSGSGKFGKRGPRRGY